MSTKHQSIVFILTALQLEVNTQLFEKKNTILIDKLHKYRY